MSYIALNWALRDERVVSEVHGVARHVLTVLADHANRTSEEAWPSRQTLSAESGWGHTAIDDALAFLIERRFIEKVGTRQRCSCYRLLMSPSEAVGTANDPWTNNSGSRHGLAVSSPS